MQAANGSSLGSSDPPRSAWTWARSFLQGKIDGGVVILSRYPIVASDVYKFNRGVFGDRYAARPCGQSPGCTLSR